MRQEGYLSFGSIDCIFMEKNIEKKWIFKVNFYDEIVELNDLLSLKVLKFIYSCYKRLDNF